MPTKDKEKQAVYFKKHYNSNKAYYYNRNKKRRLLIRQQWNDFKESQPCTDCKNFYPACVMDFDHVRGRKKFAIASSLALSRSLLKKELAKCEIVCANCHRIRTYKRRHKALPSSNGRTLGFEPKNPCSIRGGRTRIKRPVGGAV